MTIAWHSAPRPRMVAPGVTRFANPHLDGPPPPFPAYVQPLPDGEPVTVEPRDAAPEFALHGGRPLVRVQATIGADLYGLGEVCGPLRHDHRRIVGSTRDSFTYDDRADRLYQAHPWLLAVRQDGTAFGVIVETTWVFTCHVYENVIMETDGPPPWVTVIEGADAGEVVQRLAQLTGTMPMPPRWSLGFHQSRWSYEPDSQVLQVAREFRARELPGEVIWVDIDYMDRFKVFTFDKEKFPDPAGLNAELHAMGWKVAWMIDPGVSTEDGYHVYEQGREGDHFLRTPEGQEYRGVVWPPSVAFPDFTRARTRDWWAGLYGDFMALGVDAVWNDMNEPTTIEDAPDKALPPDLPHDADPDLGGPGTHARYRNLYGMLMTQASDQGIRAANPQKRPFLLTRSTFLGGQRWAACWTGDNVASWEHLHWSIPMVVNLGLSGQPMSGPDIGGFAGEATGELLARWMGFGALLPFARNHSMKTTGAQEPWAFGERVEASCRRSLQRRYRLLPYLYTLAREAATTGMPIVRPAFFADHTDPLLRRVDDAFLLGEDVFVRPCVTPTGSPSAPVPTGWRRVMILDDPHERTDTDLAELYLRPGAALVLGPVVQYSDERPLAELEVLVHPGADGTATGLLYEDDGDGHAHLEGAYRTTRFTWDGSELGVEVVEGDWPKGEWRVETRLV